MALFVLLIFLLHIEDINTDNGYTNSTHISSTNITRQMNDGKPDPTTAISNTSYADFSGDSGVAKTETSKTEYKIRLDKSADVIMLTLPPIIITYGTISNAFSFAVFLRPKLRDSTASFILTILAITDTISLNVGAWVQWMKALFKWQEVNNVVEASSDLSCKLYNYVYNTIRTFSVWVLVAVSFEKVVAIALPFQSHRISTKRNVSVILLSIFIIIGLSYIPILTTFERDGFAGEAAYCGSPDDDLTVFWIDASLRILTPFILLIISNAITIGQLCRGHQRGRRMSNLGNIKIEYKKLQMFTALLITASFGHLILTIPNICFNVPYVFLYFDYYSDKDIAEMAESQHLMWAVVTCLIYLSHSVNFLLYCFSARIVRTEFFLMIKCNTTHHGNNLRKVKPKDSAILETVPLYSGL